jgi:hypothetical protein
MLIIADENQLHTVQGATQLPLEIKNSDETARS